MVITRRRCALLAGCALAAAGVLVCFRGVESASAASTIVLHPAVRATPSGELLRPGSSASYTVTIDNPFPYPVGLLGISAGASEEAGPCPAGAVTSPAVPDASGTIAPNGRLSYSLIATMSVDSDNRCQGRTFVMPLVARIGDATR